MSTLIYTNKTLNNFKSIKKLIDIIYMNKT